MESNILLALKKTSIFRKAFEIKKGIFARTELRENEGSEVNGYVKNGVKTAWGQWAEIAYTYAATQSWIVFIFLLGHELSHTKNKDYDSTPFKFDVAVVLAVFLPIVLSIIFIKGIIGIAIGLLVAWGGYEAVKAYYLPTIYKCFEFRADQDSVLAMSELHKNDEAVLAVLEVHPDKTKTMEEMREELKNFSNLPWDKLVEVFNEAESSTSNHIHPNPAERARRILEHVSKIVVTKL